MMINNVIVNCLDLTLMSRTTRGAHVLKSIRRCRRTLLFILLCGVIQLGGAQLVKAQDTAKILDAIKALDEGQKLVAKGDTKSIHQGIDKYLEAASLLHTSGMPEGEAAALTGLAMAYSTLEEWENSLKYLNQAIPLAHSLKEPVLEGTARAVLAFTYSSSHQYQKAIAAYEEALVLFQVTSDKQGVTVKSALLQGLGANYVLMGEQKKGFEYLERSLALKRELHDPGGEAQVLIIIGGTYLQMGQGEKALEYDNRALAIAQSIPDKHVEALAFGVLGGVYRDMGQNEKALEFFNRELAYRQSVADQSNISSSLTHIAGVYLNMNEMDKALNYFNQALHIKRDTSTLNNLGKLYGTLGEFQTSFEFYSEALALAQEEFDRRAQAAILTNIGAFYFEVGEPQKAIDCYNQALPLMRAMSSPAGEASILRLIGGVLLSADRRQEALEHFKQALDLSRGTGRFEEVGALINIGGAYLDLSENQKALDNFNQALPIAREIQDRLAIATILNNKGAIYRTNGESKQSLDMFEQALAIVRAVGDRAKEVATLGNIAALKKASGDLDGAQIAVESALEILESLRTKISSEDLRASYFAKELAYYEFEIDLLMSLHKSRPGERLDMLALRTSERARARTLIELLAESHANIRQGVDPKLLNRERSLQQQLNAKAFARSKLIQIPKTEEQAAKLSKEMDATMNELQQVTGQIRQTSPRYAALTQPQPIDSRSIQAQLDADTLLLEYSLGPEHSYLWLVSPTEIKSFELPARKQIESAAARFIEALKRETNIYSDPGPKQLRSAKVDIRHQETLENASRLSQMLLGPVESQLGQKRLVIVGDGTLLTLPFAALPDTASIKQGLTKMQPLILQHEIVNLPSVSALATLRSEIAGRELPSREIAILADPVFDQDDVRVKKNPLNKGTQPTDKSVADGNVMAKMKQAAAEIGPSARGPNLDRLTNSREEADGILGLFLVGRAKRALDFDANRELVNSGELSQYRYVHFATHGVLDNNHPELTAIVLSLVDENGNPQDGFLRAHEIYNLNIPADLVVLSACETGLGKEIRGEGLIGLTRGFMYAGAPRLVVSLWVVKDESTAKLMISFYRNIIKERMRPAEALRAAQIEMLKSDQWRAPHYWAAFVLQGEWR